MDLGTVDDSPTKVHIFTGGWQFFESCGHQCGVCCLRSPQSFPNNFKYLTCILEFAEFLQHEIKARPSCAL